MILLGLNSKIVRHFIGLEVIYSERLMRQTLAETSSSRIRSMCRQWCWSLPECGTSCVIHIVYQFIIFSSNIVRLNGFHRHGSHIMRPSLYSRLSDREPQPSDAIRLGRAPANVDTALLRKSIASCRREGMSFPINPPSNCSKLI